ncbi:type II secretion system protein [Kibdelosporangium lantanae]
MTILSWVLGASIPTAVILAVLGWRGTSARPQVQWQLGRIRPLRLAIGLVAGAGVWWATSWPVAAVAVAVGAVVLPGMLAQSGNRDLIALLDGLAEWARRLTDILSSGTGGLDNAITSSARTAPSAVADHVTALAVRTRTRGLEPAMWAFADDIDHPAAHRIVASLILRARSGGHGLVTVLDGLATSLRDEAAMRRQIEADRAKARTSVRLLMGIITALTVGLVLFSADYLAPFATVAGQVWLAVVVALLGGGLAWLAALTKPPREPGILTDPQGAPS